MMGWMGPPSQSLPPESIVEREVDRILRGIIHTRALFAPIAIVVALSVAWIDDSPWRRAALAVLVLFGVTGAIVSRWRLARPEREIPNELALSFAATVPVQLLVLTATGGVDSPVAVVLPPFMVLSGVLVGRSRWLAFMLGTAIAWIGPLAVLQALGLVPGLSLTAYGAISPVHQALVGLLLVVALVVGATVGLALRGGLEGMVAQALLLRDQQLRVLADQAHDLEVAGGELAHELKNPLSSIQGLAALVSREVESEKGAARMAVLRDEAVRMSEILEEFLTYTRPLTPLTMSTTDALALATRVRDLHEGVAVERHVRVVVSGGAAPLRCDERKLQRALINLVQNALKVAPGGSVVELDVQARDAGAVIEVRDRGPGIPEELGERVFQAGVTATEGGSGLGLTIARTLVRQHDGELTLLPRPGGGTLARMELP
ncbi:MAG: HAMP domain-containing sensor histidine kinase [Myxococcota bacterium]